MVRKNHQILASSSERKPLISKRLHSVLLSSSADIWISCTDKYVSECDSNGDVSQQPVVPLQMEILVLMLKKPHLDYCTKTACDIFQDADYSL